MTTIHYRETVYDDSKYVEMFDEHICLDLKQFAQACGQSPEWVLQLLEYDILAKRPESKIHQFSSEDLTRAQRAYRLQRDFNASFSAVAMMLDLIDEVQQLRRDVKHHQFKHS